MNNIAHRLIITLALALSTFAQADFVSDHNLIINGIAKHQQLRKDIFVASFYTTSPVSSSAEAINIASPAQMRLTMTKDNWRARQFRTYWLSGIAINAGTTAMSNNQEELIAFSSVLQSGLESYDKVEINFTPQESVAIVLNGVELGTFSPDLFKLLIANWVGPRVDTEYRDNLLRLPSDASDLIALIENAAPTSARTAEIESWVAAAEVVEIEPEVKTVQEVTPTGPTAEQLAAAASREEQRLIAERQEAQRRAEAQAAAIAEAEREARQAYQSAVFTSQLLTFTNGHVRYPHRAQARNQQGKVVLELTIDRDGNIISRQVIESSGHRLLDNAGIKAIDKAEQFPAIPAILDGATFTAEIPITFRMN